MTLMIGENLEELRGKR